MSPYISLLLTFAQIAATLTGFTGVVFVLGDRSQGRLNAQDSSALFHFLFSALSTIFVSLLAALLLLLLAADEHTAWRIANGLSGFIHLFGAGRLMLDAWRQEPGSLLRASVPSTIGLVTGGISFAAALGQLPRAEILVFMLATLWALAITVISFVSLLMAPRRSGGR